MKRPAAAQLGKPRQTKGEEAIAQPKVGDRIMVLKATWLNLILQRVKTMEIRSQMIKPGFVWLGMGGFIYGSCNIASSRLLSALEFRKLTNMHRWPLANKLPKGRICGLHLVNVQAISKPIRYYRLRGAIGWNKYRAKATDLPCRKKNQQARFKKGSRNKEH